MQAELMNLEQELKVLAYIDTRLPDHETFARSVRDMKRSPDSVQWRKVLEVRDMLKTYSMLDILWQTANPKLNPSRCDAPRAS
jgi:hypothetical protein